MKITLLVDGQEEEITVVRQGDRLRIVRDGHASEVTLVHQDGAAFQIDHNGRRIAAAVHSAGDQRHLWVNGREARYERVRARGRGADAASGSLSATIPAVVSAVLVTVGQAVTAGEKLILLESMKMVIPIQAPYAGVVTAINCAAGDAVQPGNALIELTDSAESSA